MVFLQARVSIQFSLILLLAAIYCIENNKYHCLAFVSFVFVWSYTAFPLVVLLSFFYSLSIIIVKRKFSFGSLKPIFFSMISVVFGLVVNPYFPKNIKIFFIQLVNPILNPVVGIYNGNFTSQNKIHVFPLIIFDVL